MKRGSLNFKRVTFPIGVFLAPLMASCASVPDERDSRLSEVKPDAIRVMATAAIRGPIDAVLPQLRQKMGRPITVQYGSARGNLKTEILAGRPFEVALLLPDVTDELLRAGKVRPGGYGIASSPIAFGMRGDAPNIDFSTKEGVKAALLNARSVTYSQTGVALNTVHKLFSDLDIEESVRDTSRSDTPIVLDEGEYEINLRPLSEIMHNPDLKNMGAVIDDFQVPGLIEASIGTDAQDPEIAREVILFLQGAEIDEVLAPNGLIKNITSR